MTEYRNRIPRNTEMGKIFFRWLYNYYGSMELEDLVKLERDEEGNFTMFPLEKRTEEFDRSDRKFVAMSRTHQEHPPIIEATDGKWLGFKEVFEEYGVHINFLNMDYVTMMYERELGNKKGKN